MAQPPIRFVSKTEKLKTKIEVYNPVKISILNKNKHTVYALSLDKAGVVMRILHKKQFCFTPFFAGVFLFSSLYVQPIQEWETLGAYTTYYDAEERARSENIRIAASLIDGVIIQPYGEFSFNQTVGKRTQEAGFQQAKIIVNGEYVLGTGGGVCQVSTTLYNAALLSGLEVTEFHAHSLRIQYVPPSCDAMVSSGSDLQLSNTRAHPVLLRAKIGKGNLKITFYGKKEGDRYAIIPVMLGEIPPPPPIIKDGEQEKILRAAKNGTRSEAYLERYKNGVLVSRRRIRRDEYRPVQGIFVKKPQNPQE